MAVPLEEVKWIHGARDCAASTDPLIQTYEFDEDTFILRVSKCFSFEANFLYLMFGRERAILFDTGGRPDSGDPDERRLPIRDTVDGMIAQWRQRHGAAAVDLIVAHTHGHPDHRFGDREFSGRPNTKIVCPTLASVKAFFGLTAWPEGQGELHLGGRLLTVLPLPGHETSHIAVHDSRTKVLLTGDTLYPGLLTVPARDWPSYRRSAARLAAFANQNTCSHVLGAHIEMKKTPREFYPVGPTSTYQPDEHALPLTVAHLREWHAACEAMGTSPHRDIHDDFVIEIL
jgi:glyoxylase-like metal-dependent hydrolase (beta-lactamase superfamily II)